MTSPRFSMGLVALLPALAFVFSFPRFATADDVPPITFNLNFEGASLGKIEALSDSTFRCHVQGQHDERGHNRQASWFFFRMDHLKGRPIVLTLTDYVGEYNDKPGAVPMSADIVPVYSDDGEHWQHFAAAKWDSHAKEETLRFTPQGDQIWIAHIPPYTPHRLARLLDDLRTSPDVLIETIGKTAGGRDIPLITVTNPRIPDAGKKHLWLQARQHAWEAGTSYVMEGALRFIASDDPAARALRDSVLFHFTPMVDLDGCANGKVRFNANNYDVNRHWDEVDLRSPQMLALMPEIWYTKKAILAAHAAHPIDLMVNLHNTETGEYLGTQADDPAVMALLKRLDDRLTNHTSYDPARPLTVVRPPVNDTNFLYNQAKVPVVLMEQRIATNKKLGRRATVEDRLHFGRELVEAMAWAAGASRDP